MAGDEDAAGLAEVEHVDEHVVVAGVDLQPVDLREVRGVRLLDGDDVLELGELRKQVVGHVRGGSLRDVVEHDRQVGGPDDLLVVATIPRRLGRL